MKEIKLKENKLGRQVLIDADYKFELIPKIDLDIAILPLEKIIYDLLGKNAKNRKYENKQKSKP